jgi:hypothetical protein
MAWTCTPGNVPESGMSLVVNITTMGMLIAVAKVRRKSAGGAQHRQQRALTLANHSDMKSSGGMPRGLAHDGGCL